MRIDDGKVFEARVEMMGRAIGRLSPYEVKRPVSARERRIRTVQGKTYELDQSDAKCSA
jgi:hypothetical protein